MKPITTIQSRAEGEPPIWNEEEQIWEAKFGYEGALDTVNTASPEGALMYTQAEGILYDSVKNECLRKNGGDYIIFYELIVANPNATMHYYQDVATFTEYGPFVAMDVGRCSKQGDVFPPECNQFNGHNGQPKLGPFVGASDRSTREEAPYPDTWWFSLPGSCPEVGWRYKTKACRAAKPGGLCPKGVVPDGNQCTFSYKILGYIDINNLVGIYDMISSETGTNYTSYNEFCKDKEGKYEGIEYMATLTTSDQRPIPFWKYQRSIPFWTNPYDPEANRKRALKVLDEYNMNRNGHNKPLPTIEGLREKNPPCWYQSHACYSSPFGCKRKLYSQVCEVCTVDNYDECHTREGNYEWPFLGTTTPSLSASITPTISVTHVAAGVALSPSTALVVLVSAVLAILL